MLLVKKRKLFSGLIETSWNKDLKPACRSTKDRVYCSSCPNPAPRAALTISLELISRLKKYKEMTDLFSDASNRKFKGASGDPGIEGLGPDPDLTGELELAGELAEDTESMTTLTIGADTVRAGKKQVTESSAEGFEVAVLVYDSSIPVNQMDDHMLVAGTREGDDAAFQEIVNRYRNQITNFVFRMLNDYERAVDIAQETFVRIYMNAGRYQANYNFSTYIYRIASNLAITELRQRKRRRLMPFPTFFDKDGEEVEVEIADESVVDPADSMINEQRRQAVAKAIATLPEKYRTAVVLRDIEGRSYEEIAEILELSDGTVKSRINRARNLLKEKLTEFL